MNGGFAMKKDLTRVSNPQECSICKRIFLTPQDLFSHINTVHSNHHYSTFSSLRHYPNLNRNPNHAFPARNRIDMNYHRSGHVDEQGRFMKGSPAITPARNTNVVFGQQEKPKLMNLFPDKPSETLPLICQLEKRRPEGTATERGGAISSSIDLTLRL